jgi:hypothetical protein
MKATIALLAALALPITSTAFAADKDTTGAESKKPAKKPAKSEDKAGASKSADKAGEGKTEEKHGAK